MTNLRQCICVHIGQAGIQIGQAMWELFCIEHDIEPDGTIMEVSEKFTSPFLDSYKTFFHAGNNGKVNPRAVMVDSEPTVMDDMRVGRFRELFHSSNFISGKEDASNNYARGYYTIGRLLIESVNNTVKKVAEQCDSLQGFIVFNSGGGGTGSGFGSLIKESIQADYNKNCRLELVVNPGPQMSTAVVEPYNSILSTHSSLACDYSHCSFVVDNEALYDISQKKLNLDRPSYPTLNELLAQVVSSITASLRFDGILNVNLTDFQMNLVPFPRLHFPMTTYAPILSRTKASHEELSIREITGDSFEKDNQLVKCDMNSGKFIACCLLYRGDILPKDINSAIATIKERKKLQFVEWCPTGFKIGINCQPPCKFPSQELAQLHRAVCMMANSTAIAEPWNRLGQKFDLMFKKRAFVHWFVTEGMDEDQFVESRVDLEMLKTDYTEIQKDFFSDRPKPPNEL